MRNSVELRQLWSLYICLLSGVSWIKWMGAISVFLLVLGIPIKLLWDNSLSLVIGALVMALCMFANVVFFPFQILSLASSRQIGILPNIRKLSFIFLFVLNALASITVALLFFLANRGMGLGDFIAVSVLASSMLIGGLVISQKYPRAQGLVFVFLIPMARIFELQKEVSPILQIIFELSIWLAFYRHWMSWMPTKYLPNMFGMSQSQLSDFNKKRSMQKNYRFENFFNFNYSGGNSVVGSLLLGRADGVKSKMASMLFLVFILSVFVVIYVIGFNVNRFHDFYTFAGQTNIYIAYVCMAYGINKYIFQNAHKAWLYFPGNRGAYFAKIEKVFFTNLIFACVPILLLHASVNYAVLDWQLYVELIWLTLLYALVVSGFKFYISLLIYHKFKGDMRWSLWINNALLLIAIVPMVAGSLMWVDKKSAVIEALVYLIGLSLVLVFLVRHWLKAKWCSVDLVRIKS